MEKVNTRNSNCYQFEMSDYQSKKTQKSSSTMNEIDASGGSTN